MTAKQVSNGPSLECDRCHVCDSLEKALGEIHAAISPFVPEGVAVHTATWPAEQLSELQAMRGGPNLYNLISERDEWKRRAEAVEKDLDPRNTIRIVTDGELVPLGSLHDFGRIELLVTRVDRERLPMRDLLVSGAESGPGIESVRPDNSVAHLDEDLLCEDA